MPERARPYPLLPAAVVAAAAALALGVAVPSFAAEAPARPAAKPAAAAKAQGAAMKAYVDPKTGELVSAPPEGTPSPSVAGQQADEPVVEERLAGGAFKSRVPRRLMHYMTMTVAPDGTAATTCNREGTGDGPAHVEPPARKEASREK